MKDIVIASTFLVAVSVMPTGAAQADDQPRKSSNPGFFTFDIENDLHVGRDRHYTSGIRFSWTSPADNPYFDLDDVAPYLPLVDSNDTIRSIHSIGHYIFTPDVITTPNPDPTDRPYAGWLNLETGIIAEGIDHVDIWTLGIGVTGDPSLGEWGQKRIHEIVNSPEPLGWDTQLPTEPTFQLTYSRAWLPEEQDFLGTSLKLDVQPRMTLSAGTAFVYADLGAIVRVGSQLGRDLTPSRNTMGIVGADYFEETENIEWYVYAGAQGRAIVHNMFLDGGVFNSFDRQVNSRNFIGDFQTGIVVTFGKWRLAGFNTIRTQEFVGQGELDIYGGVQLSFQY